MHAATDRDWLAGQFEDNRAHLRAVAYRMLGSMAEAEDAVQDAWLRLDRSDASSIDNLGGWLTTVVARLCLDRLRTRASRREVDFGVHVPEPVVATAGADSASGGDPEGQAVLADAVGLAMLIVLDTLTPAERLAFVLHDTFGLPFEQIAPIVDRSVTATRQLASRARRRVRGAATSSTVSPERQRALVEAFLVAGRCGDFEALVRILDPSIVVRADLGELAKAFGPSRQVRGPEAVAKQAMAFRRLAPGARHAMVNGAAGLVVLDGDRPFAVLGFAFANDAIVEMDILADPERLARLDLTAFR